MPDVTSLISTADINRQLNFTRQPDLRRGDKDLVLVEDIADTDNACLKKVEFINLINPGTVKIFTLIDKHEQRGVEIDVDCSCFSLEKGFIVGYGLEDNERYGNPPAIYDLKL